jgi:hypothetical protein
MNLHKCFGEVFDFPGSYSINVRYWRVKSDNIPFWTKLSRLVLYGRKIVLIVFAQPGERTP